MSTTTTTTTEKKKKKSRKGGGEDHSSRKDKGEGKDALIREALWGVRGKQRTEKRPSYGLCVKKL